MQTKLVIVDNLPLTLGTADQVKAKNFKNA